jgi:site-specific recombinase XerD
MAYYRAVCSFFAWLEQHGIGGLVDIEPFHVAAYIKALKVSDAGNPAVKERAAARPTVKQHLAAIRMLFDWLIVGQILAINQEHAVRGPKHVVKRGKTPVLSEEQARRLLESIKRHTSELILECDEQLRDVVDLTSIPPNKGQWRVHGFRLGTAAVIAVPIDKAGTAGFGATPS